MADPWTLPLPIPTPTPRTFVLPGVSWFRQWLSTACARNLPVKLQWQHSTAGIRCAIRGPVNHQAVIAVGAVGLAEERCCMSTPPQYPVEPYSALG